MYMYANDSVRDVSALTSGLHPFFNSGCFCPPSGLRPHCQIPHFRMLLPSIWAPSSLPKPQSRMLLSSLLGSILTATHLISGCFCPPSGFNSHCQNLSSGCLCPHFWTPSSLPNTSVQDTSVLHLGSILTAKYLSLGSFCPHSWAPSLLQELLTTNLSLACIIWYDRKILHLLWVMNRGEWRVIIASILPKILSVFSGAKCFNFEWACGVFLV